MTNRPPALPTPAAARLADRLLADGRIKQEGHQTALAHVKRTGMRLEEALIELDLIAELDLLKYLASIHKTRFVTTEKLAKADIDRATLDRVPRKLAERYNVVPVVFDAASNTLSVVTADPENVETLDSVAKGASVREVRPLVARPAAVKAALAKFYAGDSLAFAQLDRRVVQDAGAMMSFYGRTLNEAAPAAVETSSRERVLSMEDLQAPQQSPPQAPPPPPSPPVPPAVVPVRAAPPELPAAARSPRVSQPAMLAVADPPLSSRSPELLTTTDAYADTLKIMVSLLENGRADLRGHSSQVARLARKLGERVGLGRQEINAVVVAAHLHDLGKMGSYHLTALNVAEYEGHRIAAQKAYTTPRRLMEAVELAPATVAALENMYERFDGAGLPSRSSGKDIPLGARMVAIVDTFADLTQNPRNPFRKTLKPVDACQAMEKYKGAIFDPHLLDLFRATVAGDDLRARILSNRHVALLVDPDPEETTVLELRMIEEGIEVRVARTTDQALELLKKGDIELVVSEIDITPRDGFALLAEARKESWGRDLPWLVLTRQKGRSEAQRAFELGIIDYVLKPAAPEVLVAKLRQALERRATAAPAQAAGVSGSLAEMALPDLIQILWHGRKSGRLRVRRAETSGEIQFLEGMVVNAVWGKLRGEEAVYAMLALADGEFGLDPQFKPQDIAITVSPEALLLEGMRRMDESERSL